MNTESIPISYLQDFKPERRLIAQLLIFTRENKVGDKQYISDLTGIPTGQSSGKVEPTIYYAYAMGLINAERKTNQWHLTLTSLGETVLLEDPYLTEHVTVWLLHLMLCRPLVGYKKTVVQCGVAEPWFTLFSLGLTRLGNAFPIEDYITFLTERVGSRGTLKGTAKLVLRSYEEDSCLGLTNAIVLDTSSGRELFKREKAPDEVDFYPMYAAYILILWDSFYPLSRQVTLSDLCLNTRILGAMNWSQDALRSWLSWAQDNGLIEVDRQTGETLVLRTTSTSQAITDIYSELL
jgi:hypothetical protein